MFLGFNSHLSATCPHIFNFKYDYSCNGQEFHEEHRKDTESSPSCRISWILCACNSCSSFRTQPSGLQRFITSLSLRRCYFILVPCSMAEPLIHQCVYTCLALYFSSNKQCCWHLLALLSRLEVMFSSSPSNILNDNGALNWHERLCLDSSTVSGCSPHENVLGSFRLVTSDLWVEIPVFNCWVLDVVIFGISYHVQCLWHNMCLNLQSALQDAFSAANVRLLCVPPWHPGSSQH